MVDVNKFESANVGERAEQLNCACGSMAMDESARGASTAVAGTHSRLALVNNARMAQEKFLARNRILVGVFAAVILVCSTPVHAAVAQLNNWTFASSTSPGGTAINTTPVNITVSGGTQRLLVVAAVLESNNAGTVSGFNATVGGTQLTALATTEATSARETAKVWYLPEASIPPGAAPLVVVGTHTQNVTGLHIYWASFSGVDQTTPINDSFANYNGAANVTFGAQIDYVAGGLTFYATGNGGTVSSMTPPAGFTQRLTTTTSGHSSFAADAGVHATAGSYAAGTTITFTGNPSNRSAVVVASLRPVTTTIGNNLTAEPAASIACPSSPITNLDNFTLTTSSGTDTINSVTVTLAPAGAFNNIATVSITNDTGATIYGSVAPGSNNVVVPLALSTNITATTTTTQYRVRITPKAHAAMPAVPGASYATTGLVTAVGHTTTNGLVYNDTTSGTITVDNASPAGATWGAITPAATQITLNWTNPVTPDFAAVVILRRTAAAVADTPVEGTTYVAGDPIGASTVVYAGNGTSFVDLGTTSGTTYHYAIFARDNCVNYSAGALSGAQLHSVDLAISKTATSPVYLGDTFTYTLNVTNGGPSTATNVTTTDILPVDVQLQSATATQGSCSGTTTVTCNLGTMANAATVIVTINVKAKALGAISNTGTVTADGSDPNPANNSSTVGTTIIQINTADVSITKTASLASVPVGDPVTYTLTVTNNGPDTADAVTVTDPLPTGMTWGSTVTTLGSCSGTVVVSCSLGNMANGASATITIVATANAAGAKLNQAGLTIDTSTTYDPIPTNDSAVVTHMVTGGPPTLPLVCLPAPPIGPAPGPLSGVINTYFPGIATVTAGATLITLGPARAAPGNQTPIAIGDLLMVIQMQDATINSTNTNNYGGNNGTGAGALVVNAGTYEFVRAKNAVALIGGNLDLQGAGAGTGLVNAYTNADASATKGQARFQVVRVPQYTTATLNGVTAAPWLTNTAAPIGLGTGGILAIDVQGVLTINTGVAASVDGLGFRGGAGRQLGGGAGANTDWRTSSLINANGSKGEGNAGTPAFVNGAGGPLTTNQPNDGYPNGSMARGAPGNAGGGSTDGNPGANDQNSGGGGGSNGGAGGTGGHSWNTDLDRGGVGAAVTPAITKLVLGGGGGAGTRNNSDNLPLAAGGAAGGGLMVIRAAQFSIAPGAILSADGASAYDGTLNDGGGGGGAGGSVIVTVTTGTMSGLTVRARGGKGGNAWAAEPPGTFPGARHGPGGGGGGGVVVYTNTTTNPALNVSGGGFGITTTANDNYFAQAGGIGQSLTAAPGLIPGIGSASDCAIDPAITLTHSPATVAPGETFPFFATVTNLGLFNPTSGLVSVTITIDSGLAFSGLATGFGWSCASPLGQSVTCTRNDALDAQTSFPPITFNATVIAAGPATLSGNTATVTNADDVNPANNTATDIVGVKAPTLARFRSFEAVRAGRTVYLNWRTSYESDNLGFRVYREVDGKRELLTKSVIAGSALFVRSREMASGRNYVWVDRDAVDAANVSYWLEDIDLDGVRQWTGPAFPRSGGRASARSSMPSENSPSLGELGDFANPAPALRQVQPGLGIELSATAETLATSELITRPPAWTAPAEPGAKLLIAQDGWYRVTRAELTGAGFDPGTNPATLRMLVDGTEIPIIVRDGADGMFDPSDSIEFYGIARDNPYDARHPYWLVGGKTAGQRITSRQSPPLPSAPSSFAFSIERKDRTVFFSALTNNGDAENFFGDVISPDAVSVDFTVQNLDVTTGGSSPLRIGLQGATEGIAHDVAVRVNGNYTGSIAFFGQQAVVDQFDVPNAWLHEGSNQVSLVANGGDDDVSVVDFIQLTYPHLYRLDSGAIRMTAPADSRVAIPGLADASLRVIDVTEPQKPVELQVEFVPVGGQQTAFINVPGPKARRLFAFTPARVSAPAAIVSNVPSNLRAAAAGADLVIIAHPSLLASMQPLRALRQSQGLVTQLVDATDIYDEFAFGQKTPYSIRSFLQNTRIVWKKKPRFVLLVGDASFDPKQYLGMGDYDLVPTKLIPTTYLKTDSDDWFVDANSDGLTELAIGRLPARTPAEASTMVSKIVAREAALAQNPTWAATALLVAGQNDGFNFESATSSLGTQLSPGMSSQTVFEGTLGPNTRSTIISMFNAGQLLVNYTGHGSQDVWSKNAIFGGIDVATLTNGSKLPVVVAMTCLNGLFDDLYAESLAETLLKAPNGGAAAVWASSALTEPAPQVLMNQELFRQLFQGPPTTLGEAVMKAKAAVSDPDVRRSWVLFGDPSMRLK